MRCRAPVVDAVTASQLVHVTAELELNVAGEDDQKLLRVSMCIRLGPRRATFIQLAYEHLEVMHRPRREQSLRAQDPESERRSIAATEYLRLRRPTRVEQVGHADAQRSGDTLQRGDARARSTALDLAQETFADARARRNRPKCRPTKSADVTEPFTDIDFGDRFGRARRNQISLDPVEGKLKRPYGLDEAVSTS
jgi:hypothetical protein